MSVYEKLAERMKGKRFEAAMGQMKKAFASMAHAKGWDGEGMKLAWVKGVIKDKTAEAIGLNSGIGERTTAWMEGEQLWLFLREHSISSSQTTGADLLLGPIQQFPVEQPDDAAAEKKGAGLPAKLEELRARIGEALKEEIERAERKEAEAKEEEENEQWEESDLRGACARVVNSWMFEQSLPSGMARNAGYGSV